MKPGRIEQMGPPKTNSIHKPATALCPPAFNRGGGFSPAMNFTYLPAVTLLAVLEDVASQTAYISVLTDRIAYFPLAACSVPHDNQSVAANEKLLLGLRPDTSRSKSRHPRCGVGPCPRLFETAFLV